MIEFDKYKTFIFDCDGVILDSNKVKTDAFYHVAKAFGEQAAASLVEYHVANGGISRFRKFEKFINEFIPAEYPAPSLDALLEQYGAAVYDGLMSCAIAPGIGALKNKNKSIRWLIVSGGAQVEIRDVFARRSIGALFDGGIFGSPDNKDEILQREIAAGNIILPALFFGDSKYDHTAATAAGLDFVFLSHWSEFKGWQQYCHDNNITIFESIADFSATFSSGVK